MSCPFRKFPGGDAIVTSFARLANHKPLECPAPIMALRVALARSKPARALRPKPVYQRLAVAVTVAATVSAPTGRIRRHTKRFSPAWFGLIHLPIPVVALIRQALGLPRLATLATLAGSLTGGWLGAKTI